MAAAVPSHLFNTHQLLSTISNFDREILTKVRHMSLDLLAMYTNIPIDEGIEFAVEHL